MQKVSIFVWLKKTKDKTLYMQYSKQIPGNNGIDWEI